MSIPNSTPHDSVLAELLTQRQGFSSSTTKINEGSETHKDEDVADDDHHRRGSPIYEPLHDPFSGSIIGLSTPDERDNVGDFESTRDELWAHMAHIRVVQSEIAHLHVQMEGVGPGPQGEQGVTGRSVPLVHPSAGDKWEDDEEDEEAEERNARELEFARLAEKFNGRKEATDNILNKLEELSQVVTSFHALKTPAMDFSNSRMNTKENILLPTAGSSNFAEQPNVIIPPPRTSSSPAPFIEVPVSISVDRPSPASTGTSL